MGLLIGNGPQHLFARWRLALQYVIDLRHEQEEFVKVFFLLCLLTEFLHLRRKRHNRTLTKEFSGGSYSNTDVSGILFADPSKICLGNVESIGTVLSKSTQQTLDFFLNFHRNVHSIS